MFIQKKSLVPVIRPTTEFVPSRHANVDFIRADKPLPPAAATMESARSAVWRSESSRRIHFVEGAVVLALMGYFGSGLAKALGLF